MRVEGRHHSGNAGKHLGNPIVCTCPGTQIPQALRYAAATHLARPSGFSRAPGPRPVRKGNGVMSAKENRLEP